MRTCTLVVSLVVHVLVIAAAIVGTALATDVLPDPFRTSTAIFVRPELPPRIVTPPRRVPTPHPLVNDPAPIEEPRSIEHEIPSPPVEAFDGVVGPGLADPSLLGTGTGVEPLPPPLPAVPQRRSLLRPGGAIQRPERVHYVAPAYPPIALAAGREGMVILDATIAEDGTVRDVRVLRSDPLFDAVAVAAVRQWRFTPTRLNGQPVPIVMTVTVGFTLRR